MGLIHGAVAESPHVAVMSDTLRRSASEDIDGSMSCYLFRILKVGRRTPERLVGHVGRLIALRAIPVTRVSSISLIPLALAYP